MWPAGAALGAAERAVLSPCTRALAGPPGLRDPGLPVIPALRGPRQRLPPSGRDHVRHDGVLDAPGSKRVVHWSTGPLRSCLPRGRSLGCPLWPARRPGRPGCPRRCCRSRGWDWPSRKRQGAPPLLETRKALVHPARSGSC